MKISPHTFEFIERWRQKGLQYPLNDCPSNYFDRFITGFILFNCLYNELNRNLCVGFSQNEDKKKAILVARIFLTSDAIYREKTIRNNGDEILRLIKAEEFFIWDKKSDCKHPAVIQLGSSKSDEWVAGLLKIIYGVRCNMFHGEKDFPGNQKPFLTPCIYIVEKMNDMVIAKLQTNAESPTVYQ